MDQQSEQEIVRLTRENNRLLHAMRRSAFWGTFIRIIFYVLVLIVAPLWVYTTYLQPIMKEFSTNNSRAQSQLVNFGDMLKQFESQFGGSSSSKPQ